MRIDRWAPEEISALREIWGNQTYVEIAAALCRKGYQRTAGSVKSKGKSLGLPPRPASGHDVHRAEIEKIVKEMWSGSFPAQEIAATILEKTGVEINRGTIGRIAVRVGLPQRTGWFGKRGTAKPAVWSAGPSPAGSYQFDHAVEADAELSLAPGARLIPFMDDAMTRTMCRFVVSTGPSIMCAADVSHPGSAWCSYHRAMVYVPVRERGAAIKNINATAIGFERSKPGTTILRSDW